MVAKSLINRPTKNTKMHLYRVIIEDFIGLKHDVGATIMHTLRKANRDADKLARLGHGHQ